MINPGAECEARQDRKLLCGIVSLDIKTRVGLGITQPLSFLQARLEGHFFLFHPREDVIAGPVQDAVDPLERIAGHTFPQRFDDGNGATDRRLKIQRDVFAFSNRSKLDAMPGEQRLVCSHDRLARRKRRLDRTFGRLPGAADQFNEDVNVRLARERERVGKPFHLPEVDAAILSTRARAHSDNFDGSAATCGQRFALAPDLRDQGSTDRAQSGDADF